MNIEGLGDAMVAQLLGQNISFDDESEEVTEEGAPIITRKPLIGSIADLYRLRREQLLGLERVGKKSADALLAQIDPATPGSHEFFWVLASASSESGQPSC
jgi:DNA ligase (NAD+)